MAALVTDIETPRIGARLRRIWLDGEPWKTTSAAVVKAVGVATGDVVEPDALSLSLQSNEADAARERALQLLGYRERSRFELRAKLAEDGYPPPVLSAIVGAFERTGLVDDHRFAESLVRSLLARGYGARRIERELARAGVEEALIAEVLDQAATPDIERERALEMAERMVRSAPDVRKLAGRLARKGFGADTSFWAARQALAAFVRDPGADD